MAAAKLADDLETPLTFYDFPAEHWVHLKTSNPTIESTFSTVRLRTNVTRGPGSRAAGLAMALKLVEAAQARWRSINGAHLVALAAARCSLQRRQGGTSETTARRGSMRTAEDNKGDP